MTEETIERYVRRELPDEDRLDIEEHLLDCPKCFEEVQLMERFVAGVRNAARRGSLSQTAPDRNYRWLAVGLAATLAAVLIGGGLIVKGLRTSVDELTRARDGLSRQMAQVKQPAAAPVLIAGNLPIALLKADRAAQNQTVLKVPASAREFALWMDVEPAGRYPTFTVALLDGSGRAVESISGVTRNGEGALSVILPSARVPAGDYTVRLWSEAPAHLLAQYNLRIAAQ